MGDTNSKNTSSKKTGKSSATDNHMKNSSTTDSRSKSTSKASTDSGK
ncbi:MAG: hypothetical protein K0S47_4289 [Herbinix sp.]|jgi:hypothetical protein|nr:hypothetical protein [Herbinix sp.]